MSTTIGQAVLELMADGKPRLLREMASVLDTSPERISSACQSLRKRAFMEMAEGVYRITEAGRAFRRSGQSQYGPGKGELVGRYKDSLRARAWRVMRMKEWWNLDELLMTLVDGTESDPGMNLSRYIRALRKAGYLVASKRDSQRYHLALNTGRLAPAFNTAERTLTDPNTGEIFHV